MLRIGPGYQGRFHEKAVAMVKSGVRVGMIWLSAESQVVCHVCPGLDTFVPPPLDPVHGDTWGECPKCKTPFVFAKA